MRDRFTSSAIVKVVVVGSSFRSQKKQFVLSPISELQIYLVLLLRSIREYCGCIDMVGWIAQVSQGRYCRLLPVTPLTDVLHCISSFHE